MSPCEYCGSLTEGVERQDNNTIVSCCDECLGTECDKCGNTIPYDEDIWIDEPSVQGRYHENCLTSEQREIALEEGSL